MDSSIFISHLKRISKTVFYIALLGFFYQGCSTTPVQPVAPVTPGVTSAMAAQTGFNSPHNIYHVVGPSETLWRISKTYNVDMNAIMQANQLSDPSVLKKGQRLLIPQTMGPRPVIPLYKTSRWTHIVVHHTATHEGDAFTIDKLHLQRGFWNGLGYHFLINNGTEGKQDGQIQVGPRWVKQMDGAHANAAGMNEKGIGIVLVGNFSEQRVTQTEIDTLVFLVKTLQQYYHIPSSNVIRHSEVPGKNTECPGLNFPWAEFKRRIQ